MERILENSLLPKACWMPKKLSIEQDNSDITKCTDYTQFVRLSEISKNIVKFVSEGNSLYLHSSICGNGKTSWAIKLMLNYVNNVWPSATSGCTVLFVYVPDFIRGIKDNITSFDEASNYIINNYLDADIVIWDDIGTKTASQFELDHLLRMIGNRINANKTNIYTANVDVDTLAYALDERLASRIRGAVDIELMGRDKRKQTVNGGY